MVNDYGQLVCSADVQGCTERSLVLQYRDDGDSIASVFFVMTLAFVLVGGCQSKGPTPNEGTASSSTAPVGTTETGGAHPATGTEDPHAGMAPPQNAPSCAR